MVGAGAGGVQVLQAGVGSAVAMVNGVFNGAAGAQVGHYGNGQGINKVILGAVRATGKAKAQQARFYGLHGYGLAGRGRIGCGVAGERYGICTCIGEGMLHGVMPIALQVGAIAKAPAVWRAGGGEVGENHFFGACRITHEAEPGFGGGVDGIAVAAFAAGGKGNDEYQAGEDDFHTQY